MPTILRILTLDGINIGGIDVYVADSFVHNGDDCIPTNTFAYVVVAKNTVGPPIEALRPSPRRTHRLGQIDSRNILAENVHCECGTNGGVPIGTELRMEGRIV